MSNAKKITAGLTQFFMLAQILGAPLAHAASTDLTDVPIAIKTQVAPNILYTLDNSGSMAWGYVPDSSMAAIANSVYTTQADNKCFKNNAFNGMYYDPTTTYLPGKDSTNNDYGDANFTAAFVDGYNHSYPYFTAGAGYQYGNPYYFWTDHGPTTTAPVNLETSFQANFDEGGADPIYGLYHVDTPQPAYYSQYIGTDPTPIVGKCYPDTDYRTVVVGATSGPAGSNERTNFANWFSFYRTRILTMKSGLSRAFAPLGSNFRVGFSTINANGNVTGNTTADNFIPIDDFTSCNAGCQKDKWFTNLFGIIPGGGTPLAEAIRKGGEYFRTGKWIGVKSDIPQIDPVKYSCQNNFQIVSTDGYWNVALDPSVVVDNQDKLVPTLPEPVSQDPIAKKPLTTGSAFPAPFYEGPTATSNTLSDVTMKYWITDLRPGSTHNVPPNANDPATWQHMVTFGIGLGANGSIPFNATNRDQLFAGTLQWPVPISNDITAIDDLWHASINGHGDYFSARNPAALQTALNKALTNIITRTGSASAVTVSNPNPTPAGDTAFASAYNSGNWSGDVAAYNVDLTTGRVIKSPPVWATTAQAQLDAQDWTKRAVGTYSGSAGTPFTFAAISATQKLALNSPTIPPGPTDAPTVIDFLRGDRSNEDLAQTTQSQKSRIYRARAHVLGDIINSAPLFVGPSIVNYADSGYSTFASTNSSRSKMLYQGANDGMLHALDATTGAERWAYVPGILVDAPVGATTSTLVNLSSKDSFSHKYYVDGTPVAGDIDTSNTTGAAGGGWISLLVGGLNKGGRGYYALDVTTPPPIGAAVTDAAVAGYAKWEFPNNATSAATKSNIGYSYGKPVIVKTKATGWVVLVTSGYNNGTDTGGDGVGHLFVLNAATGALLKDIPTGVGSKTDPSGLAQIAAYALDSTVDNTTDFAYGGDLKGNLWRFDLSGGAIANWGVTKLATLVDSLGVPQPITTTPQLALINTTRMVYVGTGEYLGSLDVPGVVGANASATQQQTFYGVKDNLSASPLITPLRSNLVKQTLTITGKTATSSANPVDLTSTSGWYVDLPNTNERSVTDPALALGAIGFTTNIPSTDVCIPGGDSWFYVIDYKTGGATTGSPTSGNYLGNVLASTPTLVNLPKQTVPGDPPPPASDPNVVVIIGLSDGSSLTPNFVSVAYSHPGKRVSWRELLTN